MSGPEASDTRPFRHYTFKHRAIAWISQNLFDDVVYVSRHGLIKGMKRRGGLGWLPAFIEPASTPEHAFWTNRNFTNRVVYDIGAFHGLLTLLFARTARHVVSYEPNARNRSRLLENVRLNDLPNVTVRPVALGAAASVATMVASPLTPGGATLQADAVDVLRNSKTPLVSEEVSVTTLDRDIREISLPAPDFIKIDVEGFELSVLQGARETLSRVKPELFIEIHGQTMELKRQNVAAVVDCLNDLGYRDIQHLESGASIDPSNSALAAQGHLVCR